MRKELATIKALIAGDASIVNIDKTSIKRTPGDTTEDNSNSTLTSFTQVELTCVKLVYYFLLIFINIVLLLLV